VLSAVDRAAEILGARARRDVPLGPLTTYRAGGRAALFVEIEAEADLLVVADAVGASGLPTLVVGRGSNLLVADAGFAGIVVTLGERFEGIEIEGTDVRAGAAASLPVLARRTAAAGLTGLEWAVGVPGSVGGGVRMNAGGHGSDISRTLVSARIADLADLADLTTGGQARTIAAADLDLGYRRSSVAPSHVVLGAHFGLAAGDAAQAEAEVAAIVRWRREHQPGGPNAGSVFTNPPGDSAGRLIDEAGLKGHRHRSAFVSPKHANFIQVDPGGAADDVWRLMAAVQAAVRAKTGVELHPEVHLVGFPGGLPSTGE
jgi:UDP-N-acetylmuramate dehydrogenase